MSKSAAGRPPCEASVTARTAVDPPDRVRRLHVLDARVTSWSAGSRHSGIPHSGIAALGIPAFVRPGRPPPVPWHADHMRHAILGLALSRRVERRRPCAVQRAFADHAGAARADARRSRARAPSCRRQGRVRRRAPARRASHRDACRCSHAAAGRPDAAVAGAGRSRDQARGSRHQRHLAHRRLHGQGLDQSPDTRRVHARLRRARRRRRWCSTAGCRPGRPRARR